MNEESGVEDGPPRVSAWPVFVAVGLAVAEVGVFVGIFPLAVFGLLLFGGSAAGILTESGYTARPWRTMLALGAVLAVAGAGIVLWQSPLAAIDLGQFGTDGVLSRALAIAVAGIALAVAGGAGSVFDQTTV